MAKPQRKILRTPIKFDTDRPCAPPDDCPCAPLDDCHYLPPPPPPPTTHLSPFLIFMFCSLAVVVTFVCYLTLLKLLRRNSRRRGVGNVASRGETHQDLIDEDHGPVVNHPIWLINTVGLDPSVIDAIEVFKFKTGEGLIEAADCSVCLGEFRDDESLRLLPKCSHAFHVSCIDTWLRSHTNCPLCRAPIVKNAATLDESSSHEENPAVDSETVDRSRGDESNEVDNAVDGNSNGVGRELPPVRRSVSMDQNSAFVVDKASFGDQERGFDPKTQNFSIKNTKGHTRSSSGIGMYSRVMNSSSFGRSSRKASGSSSGKGSQDPSY